jgi:NAD(P)-dependent dehydrogenase (short-subunit alcohol dehydrogenase family)
MSRLAGKRVLITGASSGVGLAAVERFAHEGAHLALIARGEAALDQTAAVARECGAVAHAFAADVADRAATTTAVERAVASLGGLDVLVSNAVAVSFGHFLEVDADDFDRAVAVTFTGAVNVIRAALPALRASGSVIVATSSIMARLPLPAFSSYAAAKHGLRGFLNTLQIEEREQGTGVRVAMVSPGPVDTPVYERATSATDVGRPRRPTPTNPTRSRPCSSKRRWHRAASASWAANQSSSIFSTDARGRRPSCCCSSSIAGSGREPTLPRHPERCGSQWRGRAPRAGSHRAAAATSSRWPATSALLACAPSASRLRSYAQCPSTAQPLRALCLALDVPLEVAQSASHDGVRYGGPHRPRDEAPGVDAQVELDVRAAATGRLEAPLAAEVAEVTTEVFAGEAVRLVVDLPQPVADRLEAGVDLVLDDRSAADVVAFEHAHRAHGALPLGQALEVGQRVEALLRRCADVLRAAFAVARHVTRAA